jgi:hypothetical protein
MLININKNIQYDLIISEDKMNELLQQFNVLNNNPLYLSYIKLVENTIKEDINYMIHHNSKLNNNELLDNISIINNKLNGKLMKIYNKYINIKNKNKMKEYDIINLYANTFKSVTNYTNNLVNIVNSFIQSSIQSNPSITLHYQYTANETDLMRYLDQLSKLNNIRPYFIQNEQKQASVKTTIPKKEDLTIHQFIHPLNQTNNNNDDDNDPFGNMPEQFKGLKTPHHDYKKLFNTPLVQGKQASTKVKLKSHAFRKNKLKQPQTEMDQWLNTVQSENQNKVIQEWSVKKSLKLETMDRKDSGIGDETQNSFAVEEALRKLGLKKGKKIESTTSSTASLCDELKSPLVHRKMSVGNGHVSN